MLLKLYRSAVIYLKLNKLGILFKHRVLLRFCMIKMDKIMSFNFLKFVMHFKLIGYDMTTEQGNLRGLDFSKEPRVGVPPDAVFDADN